MACDSSVPGRRTGRKAASPRYQPAYFTNSRPAWSAEIARRPMERATNDRARTSPRTKSSSPAYIMSPRPADSPASPGDPKRALNRVGGAGRHHLLKHLDADLPKRHRGLQDGLGSRRALPAREHLVRHPVHPHLFEALAFRWIR